MQKHEYLLAKNMFMGMSVPCGYEIWTFPVTLGAKSNWLTRKKKIFQAVWPATIKEVGDY